MLILRSAKFDKRFDVLKEKLKQKTLERLNIFINNEYAEVLNNHPLHGEYKGYRSINISGDLRLIYKKVDEDTCFLITLGTHTQLYE